MNTPTRPATAADLAPIERVYLTPPKLPTGLVWLAWRDGDRDGPFLSEEQAEAALPEGYRITESGTFGCDDADEDGVSFWIGGFVEVVS